VRTQITSCPRERRASTARPGKFSLASKRISAGRPSPRASAR
jgi:hypothetical protein